MIDLNPAKFFNKYFFPKTHFEHLLRKVLHYRPKKIGLFKLALTHKSVASGVNGYGEAHNERLEYLGDALLNAVVAELLFKQFPHKNEGFLTKMRAKIVSRETLNRIALEMKLEKILQCNIDENVSGNVLGNALEAIVGAIFLDRGFNTARSYVLNKIIKPHISLREFANLTFDYKSQLIEWSQKKDVELSFEDFDKTDTDANQPHFISKVRVNETVLGQGSGTSKKEAQQNASRDAFEHYIDF
jgi:ribonuclease-3